jgi:hypothetical protein
MEGDSVREKKVDRKIQLEYHHDRLIDMKMIQAYQLLVPERVWIKDINQQRGSQEDETGGTICESVIRSSKRRAHY